jgi:N-formylglutamate deformylase
MVRLFQDIGYSVAVNRPFGGSLVPAQYYRLNKRVFSIMIEINRKLYMDEENREKNGRYEVLRDQLTEIIHRIKTVTEKRL